LEPLTPHELRHTCVALLIEQGADILHVSRFLGHKDIRTTASTYGHRFPQRGESLADAMRDAMSAARGKSVGIVSGGVVVEQAFGDGK
jgi:integrase